MNRLDGTLGPEVLADGIEDAHHPDRQPEETTAMRCWCCGEERERLVPLLCHDDIKICPVCIGWLRGRSGTLDVTPILPVRDGTETLRSYY